MKKIFSVMAIALLATGLFAKTWTNNVGVGFAVPINGFQLDVSNSSNVGPQVSYDLQGLYLGYHENGFTVRGSLDVGVGTVMDKKFWGDENGIGVNLKEHLGAGYSFIRSEKFLLALTAGIGLQETIFPREDTVGSVTTNTTATSLYFSIGGDLTALVHFSQKFGMYFNLNVGFAPFGKIYYSQETKTGKTTTTSDTNYDLKSTYTITPSLGFAWTF